MGSVILFLLFWGFFGTVFFKSLIVEARRTSWSLFEALLAANILGHVVAIPIAYVLNDSELLHRPDERLSMTLVYGSAGLIAAVCMAGGAVWVFRRLKTLEETRGSVRIVYMILGLALFPSLLLFPFNLLLGWIIWGPLANLNTRAEKLHAERRRNLLQAKVRENAAQAAAVKANKS